MPDAGPHRGRPRRDLPRRPRAGRDRHEPRGKRLLDLLGASALLVLALPLLALAALGVLCALGRPVLFRQLRSGRHGAPFVLLKLRSLRDGPGEDAARLTRFGRWLRASGLDELPQLLNVLRGEMSLVGPRPLPPHYLPRFTPGQRARMQVRPGLFGLAQAAGRNAVPWEARLALDARYARAWPGLRGDLAIIARCLLLVLRGIGAAAPGHATMPEFTGAAPFRRGRGRAARRAAPSPARSAAGRARPPRPADA